MKENTEPSSGQFEQISRDLIKSMKSRKHLELLGFYCYLKIHEVWKDDFKWTIPNGPAIVLNKGELRLTENKIRKDLNLHLYGLQEMLAEMEQIGIIQLSRIISSQSGKKEYKIYKMFVSNILSMTQNVPSEQNNVPSEQNNVPSEQNNVPSITTNYNKSNYIIQDYNNDTTGDTTTVSKLLPVEETTIDTTANDIIDDFLNDTSFTFNQLKTRVELLLSINYIKKTSPEYNIIDEYFTKAKSRNFIDAKGNKITVDKLAKHIVKELNKTTSIKDNIKAPFTLEQIYDKLKTFKISMTEESTKFIESKYSYLRITKFKQTNGSLWNLSDFARWMIKLMKQNNVTIIDEDQERKSKQTMNVLKL